ncbi:MAG: hypothetical protein [Caudoviricetes sp.]|nr:MAG: hypothetical protein [Caudoviricetes sp.]
MKITFDQYSNKYYMHLEGWPALALTFEEIEDLKEQLHNLVQDVYSEQLHAALFGEDGCDGCKI